MVAESASATSVLEAILLSIISVGALVGNISLFVVVIRDRKLRTVTNWLILNLSSADILVSVISMPITTVTVVQGQWPLGDTECTVIGFITILTFIASVMSLALIAINRYYYIVHWKRYSSIFTKRRALLFVLVVWLLSVLLSLPPLVGWAEYRFIPGKSYCFVHWTSDVYYMYFMIGICFFGPLSVMIFSYLHIFRFTRAINQRVLHNRSNIQNPLTGAITRTLHIPPRSNEDEQQFTKTLLGIVACFIVCWSPFVVTMFCDVYYPHPLPRGVDFLSLMFGYTNSMCNPLFYGLRNKQFRHGFLELYGKVMPCFRTGQETPETTTVHARTQAAPARETPVVIENISD